MNRMRTMLFCPASQPKMFLNAPVFHPDAILFDLEDAVAFCRKGQRPGPALFRYGTAGFWEKSCICPN